jgi:hypothetical protein
MNRKLVHNVIYIAIFCTFPHLPLSGVKVLLELGQGIIMGSKDGVKEEVVHEAKNFLLKPTGIIPDLFHKFNPFE